MAEMIINCGYGFGCGLGSGYSDCGSDGDGHGCDHGYGYHDGSGDGGRSRYGNGDGGGDDDSCSQISKNKNVMKCKKCESDKFIKENPGEIVNCRADRHTCNQDEYINLEDPILILGKRRGEEIMNLYMKGFYPPPWNINEHPEKTEGWIEFQKEMRKDPEYYKTEGFYQQLAKEYLNGKEHWETDPSEKISIECFASWLDTRGGNNENR